MAAPVTWFEIISRNSVALGDFYAKTFGWKLEPFPGESPYSVVETGGDNAIRGGIGEADGSNRIIIYVEVDDPEAYLDRITRGGGKVVVPVTTIPDVVTFAHFADPQGNVVGLVKAGAP